MIAVIGAGMVGCLVALDIAERGYSVVLFEKEHDVMQRASLVNEGKIHLGYVYGADASFRTAKTMIDDGLRFRPLLERWMKPQQFEACLTDRFHYIVPPDSMLSLTEITAHFARVDAYLAEQENRLNLTYLGLTSQFDNYDKPLPKMHGHLLPTREAGIWPTGIAKAIASSVKAHPRIQLVLGMSVDRVKPEGKAWSVLSKDRCQKPEGPFDVVVNAAWADRRNIDRKSGFAAADRFFTRFKFGVILENATRAFDGALPINGTGTLGAYGDSVYYPQNDSLYCSWYPVGMCYTSSDDELNFTLPADDHSDGLMRQTWAGYATIDPAYEALLDPQTQLKARLIGDFIVANGQSDIIDPASKLHERWVHGPRALGDGYWSIDTGKYSSAPRCAAQCVDAILGMAP